MSSAAPTSERAAPVDGFVIPDRPGVVTAVPQAVPASREEWLAVKSFLHNPVGLVGGGILALNAVLQLPRAFSCTGPTRSPPTCPPWPFAPAASTCWGQMSPATTYSVG